MALSRVNQQCLKLFPTGYKILSCYYSGKPYWLKYFPDDRIRYMEEMPRVGPVPDEYRKFKIHESYQRWVKDVGHVVKELLPNGSSCVHVYHKDDFKAVIMNEGMLPIRRSSKVIAKYRQDRPKLYTTVGLEPSSDAEWAYMRKMLCDIEGMLHLPFREHLELITDDFINLVQLNLDENNEIDILPFLYRWALESFGTVALSRSLNALSVKENEDIEKFITAVRLTNEIVYFSNVLNFKEQYERLIPVQDYFSSAILLYIAEAASEPDRLCLVNKLLEKYALQDVITLTMDLFQGAISGIPLTLNWALYHLSRSPDTYTLYEAREQLIKIMPNKYSRYYVSDKQTQESLFAKSRVQCIQLILRETLRLIPPTAAIGRVNREDLILGGYLVPAGTMIVLQTQAACLLEENFIRPLEFLPGRFTHNKYNPELKISFPFGFGNRTCVGFSFAHAQMMMALAKILRHFDVSYHHDDVDVINRLYNEPDGPIILKLKPLEK